MPERPAQTETGISGVQVETAAQRVAAASYLDVRYAPHRRPYTKYPLQLCKYLSETYLGDPSFRKLLEVGCGRGEFLNGFAQCGFSVLGLDTSIPSKRLFDDPIVIADIEGKPMPFATDSVDVVFSKSVIEHINDTDVFLSEIYRVLRPGGLVVMMTPDWKAQFRNFYDDYTHVRPFTVEATADVLLAHGFVIRDARRFRQLPFLWRWPYLHPVCNVLAILPERMKKYNIVKFSKEWMVLVVAQNPDHRFSPKITWRTRFVSAQSTARV